MKRWIAAGVAVLALAVVACGEDDDTSAEPATTEAAPATAAATSEGAPPGSDDPTETDDGGRSDLAEQVEPLLTGENAPNGDIASVECQDRTETTYSCLVTYQRDGEIYEAFYDVIDNGDSLTVNFSSSDDPEANEG